MKRFLETTGHFFFRFRNGLFPVVGVILALCSKPATFPEESSLNTLLAILGVLLAITGQSLRLMVIGYDYIKRGGKDGKVYADHLVTGGFYAASRNPMYVGNVSIVLGFAMAYGSRAAYFAAIPFFLWVYAAITAAEESYLAKRFGAEYEEYTRQVPRFLPHWGRLQTALKGSRYDWKKALRKDYGQVFQTCMVLSLIGIGRLYSAGQPEGKKISIFLFITAALVIFFAVSRYLKKTNRLVSPV